MHIFKYSILLFLLTFFVGLFWFCCCFLCVCVVGGGGGRGRAHVLIIICLTFDIFGIKLENKISMYCNIYY